jgi:hypothetical protein
MTSRTSFNETSAAFRNHIPDLTTPRFTTAAQQTPYEYTQAFQEHHVPPWLYDLTQAWEKLYEEPYKGMTVDGTVREGLFVAQDEGFDIGNVVEKAEEMLRGLSEEERRKVAYPVDAKEWRAWSNPEFLLRPFGLRLEEGTFNPSIPSHISPTPPSKNPLTHPYSTRIHRPSNPLPDPILPLTLRLRKSPLRNANKPLPWLPRQPP